MEIVSKISNLGATQEKENRPSKQGGIYSLNLGNNNGPFLAKDIMFNNPKSIQLLVGKEIIKSHMSLAKTLEDFDSRKKKEEKTLKDSFMREQKGSNGLAENIMDYSNYIQNQLVCLKKGVAGFVVEKKRFKTQLDDLQKKVNLGNTNNMAEMAPLLKALYNTVKGSFGNQKDKIYWLTRELEDMGTSGRRLCQQMAQCEDRLSSIEKVVGVKPTVFDQLVLEEDQQQFA